MKQEAELNHGRLRGCGEATTGKDEAQASIGSSDSSSSRLRSLADSCGLALMAITVVVGAVLWAFFAPLYTYIVDDVGLLNPVYVYLHTGSMTFPTYLHFHYMVVHPPTQYLLFAWLMKAGVPLQYVGSVPPFVLILLTVALLIRSRFASEIKLALLFGFFTGIILYVWRVGPSSFGLRPDLHLAFALFAGLIALESGRLESWDPLRLGLGAFLLTYASGIHYPASLAWTGILVYIIWLIWDLQRLKQERGWSAALRPVFALILGGCAFGIPYALLFVIPHWYEIMSQIHAMDPTGGVRASLTEHIRVYRNEYAYFPRGQFTKMLYIPLAIGLPTVLISTAVLLPIKQTRGIALASLPYLLFLLLFVQRKVDYRYFLLELMLYVCSLSVVFALICRAALERFWPRGRWVLLPFLGIFLGGVLVLGLRQEGAGKILLKPRPDTMTIARAAGRRILGPHALVGERLGRFYISGGDLSYMVDPDLLWNRDGGSDLKEYSEKFDAVADDPYSSDATANDKHESLSSWYAKQMLSLRGFFFSYTGVEYLLLNAHPTSRLEGYGLGLDGRISHFSQQAGGGWEYVAAVCDAGSFNTLDVNPLFSISHLLPKQEAVQKQLEWFVIPSDQYQHARSKVADRCAIREEVAMTMDIQDANQLLLTLKDDAPIHFYEHLGDALTARYGPERVIATGSDGWPIELQFLRGPYQGQKVSLAGESAKIIFRSEMNTQQGWAANIYGKGGGASFVKAGSQRADTSFQFYTEDPRDHLTTEYFEIPPEASRIFFSVWAKPEQDEDFFKFSVQDEQYSYLDHATPVLQRADGWILFAGWFKTSRGKIRAVIQQKTGTKSLLNKALILGISASGSQTISSDIPSHSGREQPMHATKRSSPRLEGPQTQVK